MHRLDATLLHLRLVVADHLLETHADSPTGLPVQRLLSASDIRATLLGVVGWHRLVDDVDTARLDSIFFLYLLDDFANELSKLADGELVRVAQVARAFFVGVHESDHAIDEVVDVLEGAGLFAITVHGHVFAAERLDDEVRNDASVERVH